MNKRRHIRVGVICVLVSVGAVNAGVVEFTDFTLWSSQVNPITTLDFTENFPGAITNQYQALGITFTDGDDGIQDFSKSGIIPDSFILEGGFNGQINIQFTEPQTAIGVTFIGGVRFQLFNDTQLIFQHNDFQNDDGVFPPDFTGVITTLSFDRVVIDDFDTFVIIDNLFFGTAVPAPGIGALLVLAGLFGRKRRRRHREK